MNGRVVAWMLGGPIVLIGVASLVAVPIFGQDGATASAAMRTAWGEPDLQGMWETRTRAPFERPAAFGTQEFMTEAEAKDRMARGLDVTAGDDDEEVAENLEKQDQQRAAQADAPDDGRPGFRIAGAEYNAFWSADPTGAPISFERHKSSIRLTESCRLLRARCWTSGRREKIASPPQPGRRLGRQRAVRALHRPQRFARRNGWRWATADF